MTAPAAQKLHSRHKLRCDSEGQLSASWAEIERQLDSSGSTRNGHERAVRNGQFPGTLIFCEPQSVRQSPIFGSPASTSVTHAVSPADPLREQSTQQH